MDYELKERPDGQALIIRVYAIPTERFYRVLQEINASERAVTTSTVQKRIPTNRLLSPEARYFHRILADIWLNINRYSFKEDFLCCYTKSVSNAEAQIIVSANHIVFGRRGAGKSSLASLRHALEGERKSTNCLGGYAGVREAQRQPNRS